jgi:hypothetical protein
MSTVKPKYPNVKGQKSVSNATGDPGKLPKGKPSPTAEFCGIKDSRPDLGDVRQSAK